MVSYYIPFYARRNPRNLFRGSVSANFPGGVKDVSP